MWQEVRFMQKLFNSSFEISKFGNRSSISYSTRAVLFVTKCYLFGHLCQMQPAIRKFKVRFRNHKSNMLKNKRTCELAIDFNDSAHEISRINFIFIEQISSFENSSHLERLLIIREASRTAQLFTVNPHGLNKRREFRSKHRINYYNWVVVIWHFSNMTYFILILLHYHFWYLFIPKFKSSFQGFCYVGHRFLGRKALEGKLLLRCNGPFLGSCYDFHLIIFIQRP